MGIITTGYQKIGSFMQDAGLNSSDIFNGIFAFSAYRSARKEGKSRLESIKDAGANFVWGELFYGGLNAATGKVGGLVTKALGGNAVANAAAKTTVRSVVAGTVGTAVSMGLSIGITMLPALGSAFIQGSTQTTNIMKQAYNYKGALGSGQFSMSQMGYTMRQRSLNAIRQNGLNLEHAFGNEARSYISY